MHGHNKVIIRRIKNEPVKKHYGGMWKVAYADFVTAMMAFFILLWVLNSTPKENLKGIAEYFSPHAVENLEEEKTQHKKNLNTEDDYSNLFTESEKQTFFNVMSTIQTSSLSEEFGKNIVIDVTAEGMRIEIMDSDDRPMFYPGTDTLQPYMKTILRTIGYIIKDLPNYISVNGHTGSIKNQDATSTDLWSLSINRANKTREFLINEVLNSDKIIRVVGKANMEPYNANDPYSPQNIRIGIILLNKGAISNHQKAMPENLFHGR